MKLLCSKALGLAATIGVLAVVSCGDEGGGAGAAAAGEGGSGGDSAGTPNGGSDDAGSAKGGSAGSDAAGNGGSLGDGGGVGPGGAGGERSGAGTGGTSGGGLGSGGEGGGALEEVVAYDFEAGVQGWASSGAGVTVGVSNTQVVTGTQSLQITVPALAADTLRAAAVPAPAFWPGTVVTIHLWSPAGSDGLYARAFSQFDNFAKRDVAGNSAVTLTRGDWTTLTYTVPDTLPGGLQALGLELGVSAGGPAFAGGDFYVDAITASGGSAICEGTGTGTYDFETADVTAWKVDGNPPPLDTTIEQSITRANDGVGSLKVSFTALPGGTPQLPTMRRIALEKPTAYCSDTVALHVWMPAGSEALTFQAFAQYDNFAGTAAAVVPATIVRNGWTEHSYTLPAIGPGGLQVLGIQLNNTGAAPFTGDVYIDDVGW